MTSYVSNTEVFPHAHFSFAFQSRALGEGETDNVMKDLSTLGLTKRIKGQTDDTCNTQATCDSTAIYRTPDGTCNNQVHTYWGSTGMQHIRLLPNAYADGE